MINRQVSFVYNGKQREGKVIAINSDNLADKRSEAYLTLEYPEGHKPPCQNFNLEKIEGDIKFI